MLPIYKIISPSIDFNKKSSIESNFWHNPPLSSSDAGVEGSMAYDDNFHYIYTSGSWKRQPITNFNKF